VIWLWLILGVVLGIPLLVALGLVALYFDLLRRYLDFLVRVFQEKPLFIIPKGQPVDDAEDVHFPTTKGLKLHGCYLHAQTKKRVGVILFGLEFGSNRWACVPYCQFLLENGFDVFAFEFRGQGDSDVHPGYEPLQWVTEYEVQDVQAALTYLKSRGDADPRGVGFFGISRGGSAGLIAAATDQYVRCFVTDGIFGTRSTMVPYMRQWVGIVSDRKRIQRILPDWYYGLLADAGLRRIQRERSCRFPHLERCIAGLAPRPLLMIHGGADTYIKPEMAELLFRCAREPKEFWLVEGAKHNQALAVAGNEYRERILDFFQRHLVKQPVTEHPSPAPARPGISVRPLRSQSALRLTEASEPIADSR
jgi:pimeloyl-ACP methyl ester carboxylesterase